jgi:glycosyltransferase involved in cell wall biosynthesis
LKKITWISWERQRRSVTLASKLADEYVELDYAGSRLLRYSWCLLETARVLLRSRGNVVIVQNPSMILAFYAVLLRPWLGYRLAVDRHTDIYILNEGKGLLFHVLRYLSHVTLCKADFTIVTNRELVLAIEESGGKGLILPDPYPEIHSYLDPPPSPPGEQFTIFCVASWSVDEPLETYIAAARSLPDVEFIISGEPRGRHLGLLENLPANVVTTGYLSEREYYRTMASSHGVIAFTSWSATLVCGGYEAVVLGKPFITGNSPALRSYFQPALFSDGSPQNLVENIDFMRTNYDDLVQKVQRFHTESETKWRAMFDEVRREIVSA